MIYIYIVCLFREHSRLFKMAKQSRADAVRKYKDCTYCKWIMKKSSMVQQEKGSMIIVNITSGLLNNFLYSLTV